MYVCPYMYSVSCKTVWHDVHTYTWVATNTCMCTCIILTLSRCSSCSQGLLPGGSRCVCTSKGGHCRCAWCVAQSGTHLRRAKAVYWSHSDGTVNVYTCMYYACGPLLLLCKSMYVCTCYIWNAKIRQFDGRSHVIDCRICWSFSRNRSSFSLKWSFSRNRSKSMVILIIDCRYAAIFLS